MDLNGSVNEVTSILVIYNTTTLDADTCHCTYMLDITLGGKHNSVMMSQHAPLTNSPLLAPQQSHYNPDNSGNSNSGIYVSIPGLGDKNWNLPCFCLPILPQKSPWSTGSYYTPLERYS